MEQSTRHVCVKVPAPKDAQRKAYQQCVDRESCGCGFGSVTVACTLVDQRMMADGNMSPTVKAGSMFANPFSLKDYSLDESLRRFRELTVARAKSDANTSKVIDMLPPNIRHLASSRHAGGAESEAVGKLVAHLKLSIVDLEYRSALRQLRGRALGCFCEKSSPCHAKPKVLAELAFDASVTEVLEDQETNAMEDGVNHHELKRKRDGLDKTAMNPVNKRVR